MTTMKRKPSTNDSVEDGFISNAKDQQMTISKKLDLNTMLSSKPKTFPISMPPTLHKLAADTAAAQIPKVSLHDYILIAINEKIERDLSKSK